MQVTTALQTTVRKTQTDLSDQEYDEIVEDLNESVCNPQFLIELFIQLGYTYNDTTNLFIQVLANANQRCDEFAT